LAQQFGESGPPILAEDLLLLLFQPDPATGVVELIAGESTLIYILAAAVLTDLGLGGHVRTMPGWGGSTRVEAVADRPPADEILWFAWDCLKARPRGVQAALATLGPSLHSPTLDRLIQHGDIRRTVLDDTGVQILEDGVTGRRTGLLSGVRDALVGGSQPRPRVAALAALLWASGALRHLDPEIPWTPSVITRATHLEQSSWGARAATEAIARTTTATIITNVIVAAAVLPRQ
jgi:hypothetical protein